MQLFSTLEQNLATAAETKNETGLDAIFAPEFALRSSEAPEHPLSRTEYIRRILSSSHPDSVSQHGMAIRALMGVAVVSFVETRMGNSAGRASSAKYFIVDLWEANHGRWQISSRYSAPVEPPISATDCSGNSR